MTSTTTTTGSTTTTTRFNAITANKVVGKISVPQAMVESMGWDLIESKVLASYTLMLAYQPDQGMAWALAVNNVYSAWEGSQDLLRRAAEEEPLRAAYKAALAAGDVREALRLRNQLRRA